MVPDEATYVGILLHWYERRILKPSDPVLASKRRWELVDPSVNHDGEEGELAQAL